MSHNRRRWFRYRSKPERPRVRLKIGKSKYLGQLREVSLGGFTILLDAEIPVELGTTGLLETSDGFYEVSVVHKYAENSNAYVGLRLEKELFEHKIARFLGPECSQNVLRPRSRWIRKMSLVYAAAAVVGVTLLILAAQTIIDANRELYRPPRPGAPSLRSFQPSAGHKRGSHQRSGQPASRVENRRRSGELSIPATQTKMRTNNGSDLFKKPHSDGSPTP